LLTIVDRALRVIHSIARHTPMTSSIGIIKITVQYLLKQLHRTNAIAVTRLLYALQNNSSSSVTNALLLPSH
jgi:hypothetical protein